MLKGWLQKNGGWGYGKREGDCDGTRGLAVDMADGSNDDDETVELWASRLM